MFKQLWNDDAGFIISTELLLIFTILVLGLVAGLVNVRNAVLAELTEVANAIVNLNQGYSITSVTGCGGTTTGGGLIDTVGTSTITQTAPGNITTVNISLCP